MWPLTSCVGSDGLYAIWAPFAVACDLPTPRAPAIAATTRAHSATATARIFLMDMHSLLISRPDTPH